MSKKEKLLHHFNQSFDEFMNQLHLEYNHIELFQQAFSHSSFVNDFKLPKLSHNERLEFLGDAVLELMVSNYVYHNYPHLPEGKLTKMRAAIVCEPSLVIYANQLNLNRLILLGKGEEKTGGRMRPALIADVFEAFIGALYLDQGYEVVKSFLTEYIYPVVESQSITEVIDYKTQLQEYIHQKTHQTVTYELIEEDGPAHNKRFTSVCMIDGEIIGKGSGRTKKMSEQDAAKVALQKYERGKM